MSDSPPAPRIPLLEVAEYLMASPRIQLGVPLPTTLPVDQYLAQAGQIASPLDAVDFAIDVARDVLARHPELLGDRPPYAVTWEVDASSSACWLLARDLFRWLADFPADLRERVRAESAQGPVEGTGVAAQQAAEPVFVSAEQLVLDVWEHARDPLTRAADSMLKKVLHRYPVQRAVDFAAGAGYFTFYLASLGVEVAALEINPAKLSFLEHRARGSTAGSQVSFARTGQVDCVLAINAFDHLADAASTVEEIASWLAPGGILVYQAQFPEDGYHTSDPAVIERVFVELHSWFEGVYASDVPGVGLEVMRRRERRAPTPLAASGAHLAPAEAPLDPGHREDLRPMLHPSVGIDVVASTCFLHSPMFWAGPAPDAPGEKAVAIPARLLPLVRACDGARSFRELARHLEPAGIGRDELWETLLLLWHRRLVAMK